MRIQVFPVVRGLRGENSSTFRNRHFFGRIDKPLGRPCTFESIIVNAEGVVVHENIVERKWRALRVQESMISRSRSDIENVDICKTGKIYSWLFDGGISEVVFVL